MLLGCRGDRLVLFFSPVNQEIRKNSQSVMFEESDSFCLLSGSTFLFLDFIFCFSVLFPSCSVVGAEMRIFLLFRGLLICLFPHPLFQPRAQRLWQLRTCRISPIDNRIVGSL